MGNTDCPASLYGLLRHFSWQSNSTKLDSLVARHALAGSKFTLPRTFCSKKNNMVRVFEKKRKSSKLPAIAIVFAPRPHVCRCRLLYFMFSIFYLPGLAFLMRKWFHKLFAGVVYSETLVTVGPRGWLKAERRRCDAHPFPLYYFSCRTFRHLKLSVCYVFIPAKGVVGVVGG